ncbi:hypothetical protein ACOSQ3_033403 [Xanthoceras sorbifolium]
MTIIYKSKVSSSKVLGFYFLAWHLIHSFKETIITYEQNYRTGEGDSSQMGTLYSELTISQYLIEFTYIISSVNIIFITFFLSIFIVKQNTAYILLLFMETFPIVKSTIPCSYSIHKAKIFQCRNILFRLPTMCYTCYESKKLIKKTPMFTCNMLIYNMQFSVF